MSPVSRTTAIKESDTVFEIYSRGPQQTRAIGIKIAGLLRPGDVVLLVGQLGAGKTCLTQGIARGLGISDYVMSPSFVLLREHKGRMPLYHIDFYRLEKTPEIADLGLDDYFYDKGVCIIEWADRAFPLLPPEHLLIKFEIISPRKRRILMEASGKRSIELLGGIRSK